MYILRFIVGSLVCQWMISSGSAMAEHRGIAWRTDMKQAYRESRETGKPMFVQLTADWCGYCTKMKKTTFNEPQVVEFINESFIPLMIDTDENEKFAQAVGMEGLPTSVIISPELKMLEKLTGYQTSWELSKVCGKYQRELEDVRSLAQRNADDRNMDRGSRSTEGQETSPADEELESPNIHVTQREVNHRVSDDERLDQTASRDEEVIPPEEQLAAGDTEVDESTSHRQGSDAQARNREKELPPLAFDGYCLVSALDDRQLVEGLPQFGVIYAGKMVFFASQDHRDAFIAQPRRYWPGNNGLCPVSADEGELDSNGHLQFATVYHNQLWLFADEANRNRFIENPASFAAREPRQR